MVLISWQKINGGFIRLGDWELVELLDSYSVGHEFEGIRFALINDVFVNKYPLHNIEADCSPAFVSQRTSTNALSEWGSKIRRMWLDESLHV